MKPIKTPYTNVTYVLKGGTKENDLPVHGERDGDDIALTSTWEPDEEERKAIAEGACVLLTVWAPGHPPVHVGVEPENIDVVTMYGMCARCGQPWQAHYDPAKLKWKLGPFGSFGLVSDHFPFVPGIHAE